jgi:hypothetical protein
VDSLSAEAARGEVAPYEEVLEVQYGLTTVTARLRRAYYASRPGSRFRPNGDDVLVIWDDEIGRRLGGKKARLSAIVNDEGRPRCIPAFEEVALPRRVTLRKVNVLPAAGGDWIFVDDKLDRNFSRVGPSTLVLPDDALRKLPSPATD